MTFGVPVCSVLSAERSLECVWQQAPLRWRCAGHLSIACLPHQREPETHTICHVDSHPSLSPHTTCHTQRAVSELAGGDGDSIGSVVQRPCTHDSRSVLLACLLLPFPPGANGRASSPAMAEAAAAAPSISWDSHKYVDSAPETLVRDDDLSGANMDMRRRFEANCRRAQVFIRPHLTWLASMATAVSPARACAQRSSELTTVH